MVRSFFFFQAEDGIRDLTVTGVQTCALPISRKSHRCPAAPVSARRRKCPAPRSEEHTSELQSQSNLVCRLLLEKKKKDYTIVPHCLEPRWSQSHDCTPLTVVDTQATHLHSCT